MKAYGLTHSEAKFADLIWANEPIASMELVRLSEKEMAWKKSTTFTVLKKLCQKGIFKNESSVVSAVQTKEEFLAKQSRHYVEDTFEGSLPRFITAFIGSRKLTDSQADELMRLIENHKEEGSEE